MNYVRNKNIFTLHTEIIITVQLEMSIQYEMRRLKSRHINTQIYILLEQLRINNMQQTSAIDIFAVLNTCGFHLHYCQTQPHFFIFKTCFFGGMMANFENMFYPGTNARQISNNAGRASADVIIYQ